MAISNATKAGAAIFAGSIQFGIAIIVSEAVYSGYGPLGVPGSGNVTGYAYSVSANTLSDLGATCRGSVCTAVPSAYIINASAVVLGLLLMLGAYYLNRGFRWMPASVLIVLTGVGAVGVGLFPETAGVLHTVFSGVAFLFAGLSALVAARLAKKPMFYFSIILGLTSLVALILYNGEYYLGLGQGGMERMIVYPVLLWGVGFGAQLMGRDDWQR